MPRNIYIATAPNGQTFKRTSTSRTYVSAVLVKNLKTRPGYDPKWLTPADKGEAWGIVTWVGRPDLVQAQVNQASKRYNDVLVVDAVKQ